MSDDLIGMLQSIDWEHAPPAMFRLIEIAMRGIGSAGATFLLGAKGRGQAKKIDAIATAMQKHSSAPLSLEYKDDCVKIKTSDSQEQLAIPSRTLEQRTEDRLLFQHEQEQLRIENTLVYAAEDLRSETSVPMEKPSDGFVTRFFEYDKGISSEEMQQLWGRLLAKEIMRPGTYSLKTLDIVRNLTKKDAEAFEKIVKLSIAESPEDVFLPRLDYYDWLLKDRGLNEGMLLNLADLGLIYPASTVGIVLFDNNEKPHVFFQGKDAALIVRQENVIHPTTLPVWKFTRAGAELKNLAHSENDDLVLDLLGTHLKNQNYKVSIARFTVAGTDIGFTGHREPVAPVLIIGPTTPAAH
jgi:Protein of unknown function (DUF2806)